MAVVSNSSPLVAFAAIAVESSSRSLSVDSHPARSGRRDHAVDSGAAPWLHVEELKQPLHGLVLQRSLGSGEREALALAVEILAERILLDDLPARGIARKLNLSVTGTAGVLLIAKRHALIPRVRPCLDALLKESFFIGPELYDELLRLAGEDDD